MWEFVVRKIFLSILFVLVGLVFCGVYFDFFSQKSFESIKLSLLSEKVPEKGPEVWMTIFVHGSFGSLVSILNAYKVIQDDVKGTAYKKIVSKMRKEPFFYRDQFLLNKGLIKITPSFDLSVTKNKKFAAYPLIKSYEVISEHMYPNKEKNNFYTFGWSGLVSQNRRRLEAIRFYNAIQEELATYHEKNIYPKVRILSHSHGGNVIGYLAAVDQVLHFQQKCGTKECVFDAIEQEDQKEALKKIYKDMRALPKKEEVKNFKNQKAFGYWPEQKDTLIQEVFLWGMPVQPETDQFFTSDFFAKVYHFYSEDDLVQRADFFSTKKGYSDRRFNRAQKKKKIIQARIVVDRKFKRVQAPGTQVPTVQVPTTHVQNTHAQNKEELKTKTQVSEKKESIWSILFSGGAIVSPTSSDPTHKELWFFSWHDKKSKDRKFVLAPLPLAVFSPLFAKLMNTKDDIDDFDINISSSNDKITFELAKHGEQESQSEFCVQEGFLQSIRKKVEPWRTKSTKIHDVFSIIRKHFDSF